MRWRGFVRRTFIHMPPREHGHLWETRSCPALSLAVCLCARHFVAAGPCDVQSPADLDFHLDEGFGFAEAAPGVGMVAFVDGGDCGEYPLERLPASTVASLRSVGGLQRGSLRIPVV